MKGIRNKVFGRRNKRREIEKMEWLVWILFPRKKREGTECDLISFSNTTNIAMLFECSLQDYLHLESENIIDGK